MNTIKRYKLPHSINTPLNVCITVENDFVLASDYDKLLVRAEWLDGCLARLSEAYMTKVDTVTELLQELNKGPKGKPIKGETNEH